MIRYKTLIGANATQEEVDTFVELVTLGGAVDEKYVRLGMIRPGAHIIFAEVAGRTVGVAALKVPSVEYRFGLQSVAKADYSLPESEYPYELGYVSVSPEHAGKGIAKTLVKKVMSLADGSGIFATTSNPAMKDGVLPPFKFVPAGQTWKNANGDTLRLLVRDSQNNEAVQ
ncbi:GNAT family N-acetyltransferase [Martelella radicis]|uniref:GNAT superfamily N-acetyltransferase n=1 Tax=Martelella radicis TaxID=1397476 RepID=A0A7W6KJR8_9HYPH|nr:GNAT family N-acetyltransferase [Martelella radicis]MBB4122571.1 GNAT superfamily N-acetyltransferase [Martelella radicis]